VKFARFPSMWPVFCCRPRGPRICAGDYLVLTARVDSQRIDVTLYSPDAAAGCSPGQSGCSPGQYGYEGEDATTLLSHDTRPAAIWRLAKANLRQPQPTRGKRGRGRPVQCRPGQGAHGSAHQRRALHVRAITVGKVSGNCPAWQTGREASGPRRAQCRVAGIKGHMDRPLRPCEGTSIGPILHRRASDS
jgi:hypothetical protein